MDVTVVEINTSGEKYVATVQIDSAKVEVEYWPELQQKYGDDGLQTYLKAQALVQSGKVSEARDIITPLAEGTVERDANGEPVGDGWNWAAWWLACNPEPVSADTSEVIGQME